METRFIQKTGGASYIVTLPIKWIKQQKLAQKDSVEMHSYSNGGLIIIPVKSRIIRKAVMRIDYLSDNQIVREIVGYYISGVEEISIQARSITYTQRSVIRTASYRLIGFEFFEGVSDLIVLKSISNQMISFPEFTEKMFDIIYSMYKDIAQVLENKDKSLAKDIVERDTELDRIHLLIMRRLNIALYTMIPPESSSFLVSDIHYFSHMAMRLERIGDHLVKIAETILLLKKEDFPIITRPERNNVNSLDTYFATCKKMFTSLDKRISHQLLDIYESKSKQFINKTIRDKSSFNILIEDSIDRIKSYIANIAEETIDYCNEKLAG